MSNFLGERTSGGGEWAEENADGIFQAGLRLNNPYLADIVERNKAPFESYFDAAAKLLNTAILAKSQHDILKVQLSRAQQGLAPLDASQYGLGVSFGLSPETQKLALYGIGAALAVYFLTKGR